MKVQVFVTAIVLQLLTACQPASPKLTPSQEYDRLNVGFERNYSTFQRRSKSARPGMELAKVFATDPRPKYAAKFLKLAKDFPGTPAGEDAAIWVMCHSGNSDIVNVSAAAKIIKDQYSKSSRLSEIVPTMKYCYDQNTQDLLREIAKSNPNKETRGLAGVILAEQLTANNPEEARSLLRQTIRLGKEDSEFPSDITMVAVNDLYDLEHLALGLAAPKMEGEDVSRKKFKLSDYKGKVVLISFFGDW